MPGPFNRNLKGLKRGQPIPAKTINAIRDAVENSYPLAASGGGIAVQQLPNGFAVRLDSKGRATAKVTTAITPMSGDTPGTGKAKIRVYNGSTYLDTGVEVVVKSILDKTVAVNAYIKIAVIDGYWDLDVVDKCSNLS